ncbi:hypothetical protein, variant [Aphanomyces invadans]|uniref:Kinesin-like protein n=1 Tax=Aphanomyces invadans TaxID=157072 RepID=A0A024US58_9STRA|nr:hypothetical protein, variant [Aphanomyces invadans]ETW08438.1 hypothetical protein, variant [Aphanomyces invadans]|eukprot:XP_008862243.1 hypothetical protein, variant [Aphanomyces invadans]
MGDTWKIGTYARIRPLRKGATKSYTIASPHDGVASTITFPYPAAPDSRSNLKQRDELEFKYTQVFDCPTSQDKIFHDACLGVVTGAVEGYNGTILAYGQTGSGKTFTITGGESYQERGIVPRAISTLFDAFEARTDMTYKCYISYLEIYNDSVYDLLDRTHMNKPIEAWTRLQVQLSDDDEDANAQFRKLGVYEAKSEEEALNLLFLGNAHRITSDTPMNMASSRSHSIFTMLIEGHRHNSEVILHSKLHVVDLAGSERVYKRDGSERMRTEGRFINLSLHHLEQVILALQTKPAAKKGAKAMGKPPNHHVPYRNSMLTSVLRGSLGGNCKSVFIGTLNPEAEFVDESISTCRFMQRCSEVAVDVHVNEEVDVYVLAELLQAENKRLQRDLAVTQAALKDQADVNSKLQAQVHPGVAMELHASDKAECDQLVEKFLVAEWESPAQAQVAMEIERLGLGHAMYCLKSVKESLVFASNATVEVQELLNIQNDRIAGMESRLAAQRAEAETLNRAMAALAAEVQSQDHTKSETTKVHPVSSVTKQQHSHQLRQDGTNYASPADPPKKHPPLDTPPPPPFAAMSSTRGSDAIKRRMDLLKQGSIFIKHGRQGNPHPRFVWCTPDLQYLSYRSVGGSPTQPIQIPTSSLHSLAVGQTTKVFQRRGDPARAPFCFSILYENTKRSLDLEVDEGDNIDRNKSKCAEWTEALQYLIKVKGAKPKQ